MQDLTQIPGYKIFMHPVKEKDFPNYYSQIETPMDLSQIRMKINENSYATREEFLSDIRLIYNNSSKFNGMFIYIFPVCAYIYNLLIPLHTLIYKYHIRFDLVQLFISSTDLCTRFLVTL